MNLFYRITPLFLLLFACTSFDLPNPEGNMPASNTDEGLVIVPTTAAYTHVNGDGNRYAAGSIDMIAVTPVEVAVDGVPTWILGVELADGPLWVVALDDGRLQTITLDPTPQVTTLTQRLEPGQPFVLLASTNDFSIEGIDSRTVRLPGNFTRLVGINPAGDLVHSAEGDFRQTAAGLTPLPDGRLLVDDQNRILLLTEPTDRYGHGVLGDAIEAAVVTLIEVDPTLQVVNQIHIPEPRVVEGLLPIWADLNGDGQREIIVTISDAAGGAQLVVFNEKGQQVAASEPIGQGGRWRNQTAVAPFGPGGELELADVRTPHLSGTVEFFSWEGEMLRRTAALSGYTTHVIGSRNLDLGVAADVTGGQVALLLPTLDRTALAAIVRDDAAAEGAVEAWRLPLNGRQSTNIGTITRGETLSIAVGTDAGQVMIWKEN